MFRNYKNIEKIDKVIEIVFEFRKYREKYNIFKKEKL